MTGTGIARGRPVNPSRAPGPSTRVPFRGQDRRFAALLLALGVLGSPAAPLLPSPSPSAFAQEAKKDGEKEGKKEKSEEEKFFEAVGREWLGGDAAALGKRLPGKRKTSLRLPGMTAGEYRREQALSLLKKYFEGRAFTKVELKSVKDLVGTFEVEYTRDEDRRKVSAEVILTFREEKKERVLVGARETS